MRKCSNCLDCTGAAYCCTQVFQFTAVGVNEAEEGLQTRTLTVLLALTQADHERFYAAAEAC